MPSKKKGKSKKSGGGGGGLPAAPPAPPRDGQDEPAEAPPPPPPWIAAELEHGVSLPDEDKELIQVETIEKACNAEAEWTTRPDGVLQKLGTLLHRLMVMQRWHHLKRRAGVTEEQLYEGWDVFRASPRELPPAPVHAGGGALPAAAWERFWAWAEAHYPPGEAAALKAMRGAVEISWMGEGRGHGVRAKRAIAAGEDMMRVPAELMLSVDLGAGRHSQTVGVLARTDPLISQTPTLALALLLAHEKLLGDKAFFAPYVAVLPETFAIPFFWRPTEVALLAMLHEPHTHARALNSWRMVAKQYCYITKMLLRRAQVSGAAEGAEGDDVPSNPLSPGRLKEFAAFFQRGLSFELFRWAMAAVITRQNRVPVPQTDGAASGAFAATSAAVAMEQQPQTLALIPIWDMCNHAEGKSVTYFENEIADGSAGGGGSGAAGATSASRGTLVCRATVAVPAGEEVCIFYGPRPNAELLCYSGFVYPSPSNSYDRAQVSWELSSEGHPNPKLLKKQLMILKNIPDVAVGTRNDGRTYRVVATVLAPRARHSGGEYAQAHEKAAAGEEGDGVETGLAATGTALSAALRASCIKDEQAAAEWLREVLARRTAELKGGGGHGGGAAAAGSSSQGGPEGGPEGGAAYGLPELELLRRVCADRTGQLRAARSQVPEDWPPPSVRDSVGLSPSEAEKYVELHAKLHAESPSYGGLVRSLVDGEIELLDSVAAFAAEAAGGGGAAVNTN